MSCYAVLQAIGPLTTDTANNASELGIICEATECALKAACYLLRAIDTGERMTSTAHVSLAPDFISEAQISTDGHEQAAGSLAAISAAVVAAEIGLQCICQCLQLAHLPTKLREDACSFVMELLPRCADVPGLGIALACQACSTSTVRSATH